jgi:hypothetical protein
MITIEIIKWRGNWTIRPVPGHLPEMWRRYAAVGAQMHEQWGNRGGRPKGPFDENDPDDRHDPIFIQEGEDVTFVCELPPAGTCLIGAKKNGDVPEVPGTPDAPFSGWGPGIFNQLGTYRVQTGSKDQGFYKFFAKVTLGGNVIEIDPDGYCGG